MKRSSKKVLIISLIIVLILALVLVLLLMFLKKSNKVFLKGDNELKLDFTDKFVEDEYQKVTVTNISVADNYFFIKYDIDLKEKGKKLMDSETNNTDSFSYMLNRIIDINGQEVDYDIGKSYQIATKNSEDSLTVYDIIQLDSMPENFNIDIDFVKTIDTSDESEELRAYEKAISLEHEQSSIMDNYDQDAEYEGEDEIDLDALEETLAETDDSEAEPLEMEELTNDLEIEIVGTKNFRGTLNEAKQNVEVKYLNVEGKADNISVKPNFIAKTPFETFLVVTTDLDNLYQDMEHTNDPDLLRIDVQDENGNTLNIKYDQNSNIFDSGNVDDDGDAIESATVTTIIALGKNTNNVINLQPYFFELAYEEDNLEEIMNSLEWHKIENKEYTAVNEFGGMVKVKSVEEKNDQLYFEIEKTGFVPLFDALIIIRNPEDTLGFVVATEGIVHDNGVTVYFKKKHIDYANERSQGKEIEFTIMEPTSYEIATDKIKIEL